MSRVQAKPATLLFPINFIFPLYGGGGFQFSIPEWLISLIYGGGGFHCFYFTNKYAHSAHSIAQAPRTPQMHTSTYKKTRYS
jgi:hypothetical protein